MQLTFTKSKFDVAEGQYLAKFLGVDLLQDKPGQGPRLGKDGKPMAPGMAWRFEIADDGENRGKIADRVTGQVPGPKNICGRFLAAVSGTILKDGMTVDLNQFVGKLYRITVVPKDSGNGTCVSDVGLSRAQEAGAAPGRPPAPPKPKKPQPAPDSRWQWHHNKAWHGGTAAELLAYAQQNGADLAALFVAPEGSDADPLVATDHGFEFSPF